MQELATNFISAVKNLKHEQNLDLVLEVLKQHLPVPKTFVSQVLLQCAQMQAHTTEVTLKSLEVLEFVSENYQIDSQEQLILLNAVFNLCGTRNSKVKKSSWKVLGNLLRVLSEQTKKDSFPGLLKLVAEETKLFRNQGVGASEVSFKFALSCLESLCGLLIGSSAWSKYALSKSEPLLSSILRNLVWVWESGVQCSLEYLRVVEFFHRNFSEPKNLLEIILTVSAKHQVSIELQDQRLESTLLELFKKLKCLPKDQKSIYLESILSGIGSVDLPCFVFLNKNFLLQELFSTLELTQTLPFEPKTFLAFSFFENSFEVWTSFKKLMKVLVNYELQDELLSLSKTLESFEGMLKVSLLLSFNCIEASVNILEQLLSMQDNSLIGHCKLVYYNLIQIQFKHQSISELSYIEGLLHSGDYPCIKDTFSELVRKHKTDLTQLLLNKQKVTSLDRIAHSITSYIQLQKQDTHLFLQEALHQLDNTPKHSYGFKLTYLDFFLKVTPHLNTPKANIYRHMLLAIRPNLSSRVSSLDNRKLVLKTLQVFKESMPQIHNKEIDLNEKGTFSVEEEPNVRIPNALAYLACEYLPALVRCFKCLIEANCLGISAVCIEIFKILAELQPEFWVTEQRFYKKIYPQVKFFLTKVPSSQHFQTEIKKKLFELLHSVDKRCIDHTELLQILQSYQSPELSYLTGPFLTLKHN